MAGTTNIVRARTEPGSYREAGKLLSREATRTCRAAGSRLKQHGGQRAGDSDHGDSVIGRSTGLTQAIKKADSDDGGQDREPGRPT